MDVHRDGVFSVDVTGVAVVSLEGPRKVGDLHHQTSAPMSTYMFVRWGIPSAS